MSVCLPIRYNNNKIEERAYLIINFNVFNLKPHISFQFLIRSWQNVHKTCKFLGRPLVMNTDGVSFVYLLLKG